MRRLGWGLALLLAVSPGLALASDTATRVPVVPAVAETSPPPGALDTLSQWYDGAAQSVQDWSQQRGELEVRGQAVRTVVPDTATIRVGARVENADERAAQAEVNRIVAEIIDALQALGVTEQQVQTSGYNISRRQASGKSLIASDEAVFAASVSLRVTVRDFDMIHQILDAAVEKGANDIGDISFAYADEGTVYRQALKDAIATASVKAEEMADAAGVQLHALLRLTEDGGYAPVRNAYAPMADETGTAGGGTQIMAGEIEITANVTMVYAVK